MIELAFVSRPLKSHRQFSRSKGKKSKAKFAYGWWPLTLKQMKKEKGMVTRTRSQQMMVRIHPHTPIPVSLSSAVKFQKKNRKTENKFWVYLFSQIGGVVKNWQRHKHPSSAGPPNWGATLVLMMAGSNIFLFSSDTFWVLFFCLGWGSVSLATCCYPAGRHQTVWRNDHRNGCYIHITWTWLLAIGPIELNNSWRGRVSTSNVFCWLFENVWASLVAMPTTHTHNKAERERDLQ